MWAVFPHWHKPTAKIFSTSRCNWREVKNIFAVLITSLFYAPVIKRISVFSHNNNCKHWVNNFLYSYQWQQYSTNISTVNFNATIGCYRQSCPILDVDSDRILRSNPVDAANNWRKIRKVLKPEHQLIKSDPKSVPIFVNSFPIMEQKINVIVCVAGIQIPSNATFHSG